MMMFWFPIYQHISCAHFTNKILKSISVENSFNPMKVPSAFSSEYNLMLECKLVRITQMKYYEMYNTIIKVMALQNHS
jgi:hypothetical protein